MRALILFLLCIDLAFAGPQSSPNLLYGQVPSAAQWNSYFANKLDYNAAGLPIDLGGTAAITAQGAINNLTGITSGYYLRGNGTNAVMSAILAADVPILNQNTTGSAGSVPYSGLTGTVPTWNQNTTGTAANITGITAIANGGTGAATLSAAQTALGIVPNLSGTSAAIGGSALAAGAVATGTVAITGATTSMAVVVTPSANPGAGIAWSGYISATGTVTVVVTAIIAATPVSTTYNVRVIP